jgi:hypothetical protein
MSKREREYTWHESISGWEAARVGYARQQAAAAARQTKNSAPPASSSAPAKYDYDRNDDWKRYVGADGSIRSTPRGGWVFP